MNDRISLPEAARRANVSPTSVRRWIDAGKLKATKGREGSWNLSFEDLRTFLATVQPNRRATVAPPVAHPTHATPNSSLELEGYREALLEARTALERERRNNDELREQLKRFESEIFKLTSEMQALLSRDSPTGVLSRWVKSKIAS